MTNRRFEGRPLIGGMVKAEMLVSHRALTFAHGVDPGTGTVSDIRSDVKGENVRGKVLVYPYGKGSTTASSWFLEAVRQGNAPAAIITEFTDLSAVIGAVLAKEIYGKTIPVVASPPNDFFSSARSGVIAEVNGDRGEVLIST